MIDAALDVAPTVDAAAGWRPALRERTRQLCTVFRRHPWPAHTTVQARPIGPRELSWLERAVSALAGNG